MSINPPWAVVTVAPTALPIHSSSAEFQVRRVYCVGRNYLDHVREMGEADERDPPFFFQKPSDAIVRDGAVVPYPPQTRDFQFEVELVVAIKADGLRIAASRATDHVFGYAVGLDMTRRDRQREARDLRWPWEMGKSFDHSAPCGALHPAAEVGHLARGRISLALNGVERQRGDLAQMIWNVPEIIAKLSESYALAPGDLIFTGTPAGVGAVVPGDQIEGRIEGLAPLRITIGPMKD